MRAAWCVVVAVALVCWASAAAAQEAPKTDSARVGVRSAHDRGRLTVGLDYGAGTLHGDVSGPYFAVTLDGTSPRGRSGGVRFAWMTGGDGYYALLLGLDRSVNRSTAGPWGRIEAGLLIESEFAGPAIAASGGFEVPTRLAAFRLGVLAGWHGTRAGPLGGFVGVRL